MAAVAAIPGLLASMSGTTAAVAASAAVATTVAANSTSLASAANAANAAKPSMMNNLKVIGMWILIIGVIAGLIYGLYELFLYTKGEFDTIPTCENIENTAKIQEAKISKAATELSASRSAMGTGTADVGLDASGSPLAENENALINFAVLGVRSTGYLGPKDSGVFRPAAATNYAFLCGARVFVLDIDYLEADKSTPVLVYRDNVGNLRSNNIGRISEVAATMATFNTSDPIIVVLNILRVPGQDQNPASTEALKFMMKISKALKPIHPRILKDINGNNATGQRMASSLFLFPVSTYQGKIILLTNQDTTGFTKPPSTMPSIQVDENLHIFVNARLYPITPNKSGDTPPSGTAARMESVQYYTSMSPDDKKAMPMSNTKSQWNIAMNPVDPMLGEPSKADIDLLHKTLGVQCIPTNFFNLENIIGSVFFTSDYFKKFSYRPKPKAIRYVATAPLVSAPPAPQTNTGGGFLDATSARNA